MSYFPGTGETIDEVKNIKKRIDRFKKYFINYVMAMSCFSLLAGAFVISKYYNGKFEFNLNDKYGISISIPNKERGTTIEQKIQELNLAQDTMKDLIVFIGKQKESLNDLSDKVENLKKEKNEIEPVLTLTKEQIGALLASYESKVNVWVERFWGFITGFLTSVLGGLALAWLAKVRISPSKSS